MRLAVITLITILSTVVFQVVFAKSNRCSCTFNTQKYRANCFCGGHHTCTVAVSYGRYCQIACDGNVPPNFVAMGYSKFFGRPETFYKTLSATRSLITHKGFTLFSNYRLAMKALPGLLRSGYIVSEFISNDNKGKLDRLIYYIFQKNGPQILRSFLGISKPIEFSYHGMATMTAVKKSIDIQTKDFRLRVIYLK